MKIGNSLKLTQNCLCEWWQEGTWFSLCCSCLRVVRWVLREEKPLLHSHKQAGTGMAQILYLFFTGSPARWGWIVIPNTAPASISSSPWLFCEAELACSRANSLHCSSSVTRADGFCALKCSCSLTLAAVDSHGNFWVAASSYTVTVVSLVFEPLCRAFLQIYY